MEKRSCKNCRRLFKVCPQRPNQKYCSTKKCQQARKNAWQRKKMRTDRAYRQNQQDAQDQWLKNNPDYYERYRKNNPVYAEKTELLRTNGIAKNDNNQITRPFIKRLQIWTCQAM